MKSAAGLGLARMQENTSLVQEFEVDDETDRGAGGAYVETLRFAPCLVPFEDRAIVFQDLVENDHATIRGEESTDQDRRFIAVRRNLLLADSFSSLHSLPSNSLKRRIRIRFFDEYGEEEAGIDGGGLFKEFMERLVQVRSSMNPSENKLFFGQWVPDY